MDHPQTPERSVPPVADAERKPFTAPVVEELGTLNDLTLQFVSGDGSA